MARSNALPNAFYKMDEDEGAAVLADANPLFRDVSFDAGAATMLAQDLDFYPGYKLVEIVNYNTMPAMRRLVLHKPGHAVVLNWTNAPIYTLNQHRPPGLTMDNVMEYVRFFYANVHGQNGRFAIVETVNDIPWHEDPPPAARKAVGRMIQPMQVIARDKDGTFSLFACIAYQTALFRATVKVTAQGYVTLHDQEMLVEDMPVRDDILGQ